MIHGFRDMDRGVSGVSALPDVPIMSVSEFEDFFTFTKFRFTA